MLKIEDHFLDTNMVLTVAFKDSNFDACLEYYKLDYTRHIGYNVKNEIYVVIERLKLISLEILQFIKGYVSSNNISLYDLDYHIGLIQDAYLNQFKDEEYVFHIRKKSLQG